MYKVTAGTRNATTDTCQVLISEYNLWLLSEIKGEPSSKTYQNKMSSWKDYNKKKNTVEPGYNDIDLCKASSITSDILGYKLVPHC
jgi:hypothetical protein